MGENKKYYWLKFRKDFFKSLRIKKLRKLAGGDTFTIIYLKLQLLSLTTGGCLEYKGIFDSFEEEMAEEIEEDVENVKVTVQYLLASDLMRVSENRYYLPYVEENTGSETESTIRSRECRARKTEKLGNEAMLLQCNTDATEVQPTSNTDIRDKRKNIDINNLTVIRANSFAPIIESWNSLGLNKIISLKGKRATMLNARIKEYGLENVLKAIGNIRNSSFLRGQNRTGWTISFDWLIKPTNFLKVLEGNYSDDVINKVPEKKTNKGNQFNRFEQNEYDFAELEKDLLGD